MLLYLIFRVLLTSHTGITMKRRREGRIVPMMMGLRDWLTQISRAICHAPTVYPHLSIQPFTLSRFFSSWHSHLHTRQDFPRCFRTFRFPVEIAWLLPSKKQETEGHTLSKSFESVKRVCREVDWP